VRSLNRFALIGNVASLQQFDKVVKITLATERAATDMAGKSNKSSDFIQVSLVNERQRAWTTAHVGVADEVFVEGRIQSRKFEKK
jgi:single-strand DNA-binding protein